MHVTIPCTVESERMRLLIDRQGEKKGFPGECGSMFGVSRWEGCLVVIQTLQQFHSYIIICIVDKYHAHYFPRIASTPRH